MNEENKNIVNNENNVEMPVANDAPQAPTNPLDQTITPKMVTPTPVEAAPAPASAPAESPAPAVTPAPAAPVAPAAESQKEVGSVVVGKPMSNIIKPIPVGDIQGSGPVASVGGGNASIEPKKKSNVVSVIVLIVAILVLIGIILFKYVFNGKINLSGTLTGTVQTDALVYKGAKKGDKITFGVTDTLKLILTIDEYEVQEGVGTKVACSIKEADGSESVSLSNIWLENDNVTLKVPFNKVGNYAVLTNSITSSELSVISPEGKVTKYNDMASYVNEESGLIISFTSATTDEIQIEASRETGMGALKYGTLKTEIDYSTENEDELSKFSRYSVGDGFIYCLDNTSKIPEGTTVNASFTIKLTDGKLNLDNPTVSDKTDFKTFLEQSKDIECVE